MRKIQNRILAFALLTFVLLQQITAVIMALGLLLAWLTEQTRLPKPRRALCAKITIAIIAVIITAEVIQMVWGGRHWSPGIAGLFGCTVIALRMEKVLASIKESPPTPAAQTPPAPTSPPQT